MQAREEIEGSLHDISNNLDLEPTTFAYPYGEYSADIARSVAESGFQFACTVDDGLNNPATDNYRLRRTEITGKDSLFRFMFKVRFGAARLKAKHLIRLL